MKVRLLRDARIRHKAGEIVEVSPAECSFLVSVGSAEILHGEVDAILTPEDGIVAETPEKKKPTRRTKK